MPFLHQFREKLQEKRDQQQPNVHAVHVRIRGHHHVVVAEVFQSVFNVQRRLQEVELLVLVHHFFGQTVAVQWFALETEHRLREHVPGGRDGAGSGISFRNEEGGFQPTLVFEVVVVDFAVPQLAVVQGGFLGAFAG